MKLMVSGYGETKQQFGTMRCVAKLDSDTVSFAQTAAAYKNGAEEAGVVIKGRTLKVGLYAADNPVNIILHGMNAAEAILLADKLLEYARDRGLRERSIELQRSQQSAITQLMWRLWGWARKRDVAALLAQQSSMALQQWSKWQPDDFELHKGAYTAARELLERANKLISQPSSYESAKVIKPAIAFSRDEVS